MQPSPISIRTFRETLPHVAAQVAKGQAFVVMRHAKPLFRVEPLARKPASHAYTLADLASLRFKGGKRASATIDHDVYRV